MDLLFAQGEADANMYLCSRNTRKSERSSFLFSFSSVTDTIETSTPIRCYLFAVNVGLHVGLSFAFVEFVCFSVTLL